MRKIGLFCCMVWLGSAAPAWAAGPGANAPSAGSAQALSDARGDVEKAKSRLKAADAAYQSARDRVLDLREERGRLSNHVGNAERRKIRTTKSWSKHADADATDDVRDSRTELNRVNRAEARATTRLDEATQEQESARKALANAEKRYQALGGK